MSEESTEPSSLTVSRAEAVATVTLGPTGSGNALTTRLKNELRDTLADLADDPECRAVVLTGAGRSFCVGQDLGEHAETLRTDPGGAFATVREHYAPIVTSLATMPKPVIAAINGSCVGGGLGFALACDLRIAAASARFATAFTGIGLTCDSGLSISLTAAIGPARASELLLLGTTLDAERAAEWGLVSRVVPDDELAEKASTQAHRLASGPTAAYAETKRLLAAAGHHELAATLDLEADAQERLGQTADHRNAVDAFLAKEAPTFTGQ